MEETPWATALVICEPFGWIQDECQQSDHSTQPWMTTWMSVSVSVLSELNLGRKLILILCSSMEGIVPRDCGGQDGKTKERGHWNCLMTVPWISQLFSPISTITHAHFHHISPHAHHYNTVIICHHKEINELWYEFVVGGGANTTWTARNIHINICYIYIYMIEGL